MADILYVQSGYVDTGYFAYTADAGATLTSTAHLPPDPYFVTNYVTTDYVVTPEFLASRIRTVSGTLATATTLVAQPDNIVKAQATIEGMAATLTIGGRLSPADLAATITSTVTVAAGAIRDPGLSTRIVRWDQVDRWDPWFGTYWDPAGVTGQELPAYAAISATAEIRQTGSAVIATAATISATAQSFSNRSASLNSQVTLAAVPARTRRGDTTLTTTSTVTVTATTVIEGTGSITATVSLAAQAQRTRTAATSVSTQASITTVPVRIRQVTGELQAFNTQLTAAARTRVFGAALTVSSAVNAQAVRTAAGTVTAATQAQIEVTGLQIAANRANLFTVSQVVAQPTRIRRPDATGLTTATTLGILAGFRASGTAQLEAFDFVLATGRSLPIKTEYQLRVAQETRQFLVLAEARELGVTQETRVNMVLAESRSLAVPEETRVLEAI